MGGMILTGFEGAGNSSQLIVSSVQTKAECRKLILPNDKERSVRLLYRELSSAPADYVVMMGQKPSIKDKIAVERCARLDGRELLSALDCDNIAEFFKAHGYDAYLSAGAGNSYCNHIYAHCLSVFPRGVFLHIPALRGISDMDRLQRVVGQFLDWLSGL